MSNRPLREPGDDSIWDGRTMDSLVDAKILAPRPPPETISYADALREESTCLPEQAQSPIEEEMFGALIIAGFTDSKKPAPKALAVIHPQHPIHTELGLLHPDYAVVRQIGRRTVKVAIELDGHEFHQKTKQQVERDYRRGRAMAREGWTVVRFTGSEVHRDARACALEIAGVVIEAISRIREGR